MSPALSISARRQTSTDLGTGASDSPFLPSAWTCQNLSKASSAHPTMAFKNEVVSDEDIDRYNLPFPKGEDRWWTRDAERDYYLWGGIVGNRAYDAEQEGMFHLYVDKQIYFITIRPGNHEEDTARQETIFRWSNDIFIEPKPSSKQLREILSILKEALACFGHDGRQNLFFPKFRVIFDF